MPIGCLVLPIGRLKLPIEWLHLPIESLQMSSGWCRLAIGSSSKGTGNRLLVMQTVADHVVLLL